MRLKLFLATVLSFLCLMTNAQSRSYSMATTLGDNLRLWQATGSNSYRENIDRLCSGKIKATVANELAQRLSAANGIPKGKSYEMDSYLNWLEDAFQSGLKITTSSYQKVDASKIHFEDSREAKFSNKNDLEYYKCNVNTTGSVSLTSNDLIIVYEGRQIAKIDEYREDASGKVHTSLSDIMSDVQTFGATYNYSKENPLGISLNWGLGEYYVMLSLDYGMNFDKDNYFTHDLNMTDVMNYTRTVTKYDSKFYLTLSPQFYLKYFSVGCGFGVMYLSKDEYKYRTSSASTSSSTSSSSYSSSNVESLSETNSTDAVRFMIRPTVKGFIPISDEWYITVSAAYNYTFGYKEKNGFDFGIGAQFNIDW